MAANIFKARFVETVKRTATVESFRFAPDGKIDFIPGQFLHVIFDTDNLSNSELNKYLSFSCAPGKGYIEVTKRLSESLFSQRLRGLKMQDEVYLKAPLGNCVFKEEYKKIAFLIGGIGITPVISILEYIAGGKLDTDACLVYSNRNEDEIAFRKELDGLAALDKFIKIRYVVTECQPKDRVCIFGRIDQDLIKKNVYDITGRTVFIFGPPKMVEAMQGLCLEMGCTKENLRVENFLGY